ncbi:MAG: OmpA family protein [Saprospiraceae bacterium]|nr:OmpA family protein [Saprospiraceae bacterium]
MNAFLLRVLFPLLLAFGIESLIAQPNTPPPSAKPPLVIITDPTWDVSCQPVKFGEYPLSAEQIIPPDKPMYGGTCKAAAAAFMHDAQIIEGSIPIWRNHRTDSEMEAYQFRKTVALGNDRIKRITLQINSDDITRVYINQRLASADKRDGTMKDGYDDWYTFRSVSSFTYRRTYTYDVTDFFFTNVTNNIFIEAVSLAFDGGHAYVSAKFVIEFEAAPPPPPAKTKIAPPAKPNPQTAPAKKPETQPASPNQVVFEAGRDPEFEKLKPGSILELGNVYFKVNDYTLDSASYQTLAAFAGYLKKHPSLKIEVGGHTNLLPKDQFAAELSTQRARAVARYLTDNGVASDRVVYKGYGKTQPRVRATTKEANKANQRVEVKVLAR